MAVITITGTTGTGAPEVGAEVARIMSIDYVDRLILAEAARRIGATVEAVAAKVEKRPTLGDRVGGFLRTAMERSAMDAGGADPYFGPGLDTLLVQEYKDMPEALITSGHDIDDARLLEVTRSVIEELARKDNVLIIGRGANVILHAWPGALHVGLTASHEKKVERIIAREVVDQRNAEKYIVETDRGRLAYYQRFFKTSMADPLQYHLMINTDLLDVTKAAEVIVQIAHSSEKR